MLSNLQNNWIKKFQGQPAECYLAVRGIFPSNYFRIGQACSPLIPREHEGTEKDTEGIRQDMSMPLKLFLVSGNLFSETSAQITTSI